MALLYKVQCLGGPPWGLFNITLDSMWRDLTMQAWSWKLFMYLDRHMGYEGPSYLYEKAVVVCFLSLSLLHVQRGTGFGQGKYFLYCSKSTWFDWRWLLFMECVDGVS